MAGGHGYPKGIAKREEILGVALALIAEKGYEAATVRALANAVGLSKTGLVHHFGTKEELFRAILQRRDEIDTSYFNAATFTTPEAFPEILLRASRVPGLVQLYIRFISEAIAADHPAHDYFADRYDELRTYATGALSALQETGELDPSIEPASLGAAIIGALEGLELQWLYNPDLNMEAALTSLFDAILEHPGSSKHDSSRHHASGSAVGSEPDY